MAEEIVVSGVDVKIRHPWGAWALSLITLGIYGLVWWFKINRELRDYSAAKGQPFGNDPALSLLALFPGGAIIVPAIWTYWTTTGRIAGAQELSGTRNERANGWLTLLLAILVFSTHIVYLQYALNSAWRAEGQEGAAA
ncbi:MAG: DUF4234 domain-containing protein [Miltoncostaeaceae bacterium]